MHGKAQGCAKWLQCDFLSYRNTSHKAGSHLSEARKLGGLFPSRKLREGGPGWAVGCTRTVHSGQQTGGMAVESLHDECRRQQAVALEHDECSAYIPGQTA